MPFTVSRHMRVPPDRVWAVLTDVSQWPRWGPSITGAELAASRFEAGSTGTVRTLLGVRLPFRITDVEPGCFWSWSVAGIRATGHRVVAENLGCRVTFSVPWWGPAYLAVCAVALRRIERLVAGP